MAGRKSIGSILGNKYVGWKLNDWVDYAGAYDPDTKVIREYDVREFITRLKREMRLMKKEINGGELITEWGKGYQDALIIMEKKINLLVGYRNGSSGNKLSCV